MVVAAQVLAESHRPLVVVFLYILIVVFTRICYGACWKESFALLLTVYTNTYAFYAQMILL